MFRQSRARLLSAFTIAVLVGELNSQPPYPGFDSEKESKSGIQNTLEDWRIVAAIALLIIVIQATVLRTFGQPWISRAGYIKLWHGNISDTENSQHITDWYTFTHIVHGVIYYGILSLFSKWLEVETRYLIAVIVEASWELLENSPSIITRYRSSALAAGYVGDSILNSVCDTLAMSSGFWLTDAFPPLLMVGLVLLEESFLLFAIRDNLTLNIFQLIHPSEALSKWQSAREASKEEGGEKEKLVEKKNEELNE